VLLAFLTPMNLAIALFWFEVFTNMGLFDVYNCAWFLVMATFLRASIGVCIFRNTLPPIVRDMRSCRLSAWSAAFTGTKSL